ncbi:hypothetical protein BKA70DRAFT_1421752 [Coprinopsis sp. MPI-PUGE-AT-0042]|nr:hypothetical protein BKA70DRAFT_1421752 [Coprinopsis sp. MPI-PUGE-AT-0042]
MLRMNGVEAWISGDDKKPFPVYSVQKEASTGVVTCWIPFEPGSNFSIRWRDLDDMLDIGGFVTMDGCHYGGRLIRSRSYAPAVFSRIPTTPTESRPLSFPFHSPNHHSRAPLGGSIILDVHIVSSGSTKIHEGLSPYAERRLSCCSQAPLLTSLLPSSSTEVVSLGKLATFIFQYRTPNFLRMYGIAPIDRQNRSQLAITSSSAGDKRSAATMGSDDDDEGPSQYLYRPPSLGSSPASSPTQFYYSSSIPSPTSYGVNATIPRYTHPPSLYYEPSPDQDGRLCKRIKI